MAWRPRPRAQTPPMGPANAVRRRYGCPLSAATRGGRRGGRSGDQRRPIGRGPGGAIRPSSSSSSLLGGGGTPSLLRARPRQSPLAPRPPGRPYWRRAGLTHLAPPPAAFGQLAPGGRARPIKRRERALSPPLPLPLSLAPPLPTRALTSSLSPLPFPHNPKTKTTTAPRGAPPGRPPRVRRRRGGGRVRRGHPQPGRARGAFFSFAAPSASGGFIFLFPSLLPSPTAHPKP